MSEYSGLSLEELITYVLLNEFHHKNRQGLNVLWYYQNVLDGAMVESLTTTKNRTMYVGTVSTS